MPEHKTSPDTDAGARNSACADRAHSGGPIRKPLPQKYARKLTSDEINRLDRKIYTGAIRVVGSHPEMVQAVRELRRERLLGFDTETRPSFRKGESYPPALVQLAGQRAVYLFQLRHVGLSRELAGILSNPGIVKAGVAVDRDIKDLRNLAEFEPRGFVDLGVCAKRCGMQHHGLRGLAALLLGCRISKGARLCNWNMAELPASARQYAATDAWVGRRLYEVMKQLGCL